MNKIGYEIKILDNMIERKLFSEYGMHCKMNPTKQKIMTPIHAKVIEYLMENQESNIYQRDIELNFKFRKSTISGILSTMEKNNIIERIPMGRTKKIVLTDVALNKVTEIKKRSNQFEQKLIKNISEEELNIFFEVIDKIKKNISA